MSKPYYVKFETPKELVNAVFELIKIAMQTGKVRKGTNETTKSVERGQAKLVVIAEDVEPPEVVAHLPILCDERKCPYVYVPSKQDLGKAVGIEVGSASISIVDPGEGKQILEQIINSINKLRK